jgi:hypothetical protein
MQDQIVADIMILWKMNNICIHSKTMLWQDYDQLLTSANNSQHSSKYRAAM